MPNDRKWWIDEGITEPSEFFSALPEALPTATHFEVEGTRISPEAKELYAAHEDGSRMLSSRQTLSWSRRFRCVLSPTLLGELARIASKEEPAKLFDHITIYNGDRKLLDWHDAFANSLFIAPEVPEEKVRALAGRFGVGYKLSS
jgi:hypothetical protein